MTHCCHMTDNWARIHCALLAFNTYYSFMCECGSHKHVRLFEDWLTGLLRSSIMCTYIAVCFTSKHENVVCISTSSRNSYLHRPNFLPFYANLPCMIPQSLTFSKGIPSDARLAIHVSCYFGLSSYAFIPPLWNSYSILNVSFYSLSQSRQTSADLYKITSVMLDSAKTLISLLVELPLMCAFWVFLPRAKIFFGLVICLPPCMNISTFGNVMLLANWRRTNHSWQH